MSNKVESEDGDVVLYETVDKEESEAEVSFRRSSPEGVLATKQEWKATGWSTTLFCFYIFNISSYLFICVEPIDFFVLFILYAFFIFYIYVFRFE